MNKRGQVLAGIIVLLLIISILVPVMVYYSQREAQWTVKGSRSTKAFHLAESGMEKGFWAISVSSTVWATLQNGGTLTNYHFDRAFTDVTGGTYTIGITSGPQALQATVISIGRDSTTKEVRAIKAVYSGTSSDAGIYASGITMGGGPNVQWGAMMSLNDIALSGSSDVCYPQKYAVGTITGMSAACHASAPGGTYGGGTSPCSDNTEWWVYNCPPGVPPALSVKLDVYKAAAQAASCPHANYANGASPADSCYWPVGQNPSFSYVMPSSRTVYVEGNLGLSNGCAWGSFIVMGNLTFSGNGNCGALTVAPPSDAWKQYQKYDTAAAGEFMGDTGYQTMATSFNFNVSGGKTPNQCPHASCASGTSSELAARGLFYVGGTITANGGNDIYGVVFSPNSVSGFGGNTSVWYDPTVAAGITMASAAPSRLSWQEILTPWPTGL